jgi:hypothetical protein
MLRTTIGFRQTCPKCHKDYSLSYFLKHFNEEHGSPELFATEQERERQKQADDLKRLSDERRSRPPDVEALRARLRAKTVLFGELCEDIVKILSLFPQLNTEDCAVDLRKHCQDLFPDLEQGKYPPLPGFVDSKLSDVWQQ